MSFSISAREINVYCSPLTSSGRICRDVTVHNMTSNYLITSTYIACYFNILTVIKSVILILNSHKQTLSLFNKVSLVTYCCNKKTFFLNDN